MPDTHAQFTVEPNDIKRNSDLKSLLLHGNAATSILGALCVLKQAAMRGPSGVHLELAGCDLSAPEKIRILLSDDGTQCDERAITTIVNIAPYTDAGEQGFRTWATAALEQVAERANRLLPTLNALVVGEERQRSEVNYSDPAHALELLRDRGCEIHDENEIHRLVEQDPGPTYYGDIDLGDDGHNWEHGGGRWADRIEAAAARQGALTPACEKTAPATMRDAALEVQRALTSRRGDPEQIRELADQLAGETLRLSRMLSEPDWGVGMLEDIHEIVGSDPNPNDEPRWDRH